MTVKELRELLESMGAAERRQMMINLWMQLDVESQVVLLLLGIYCARMTDADLACIAHSVNMFAARAESPDLNASIP